MKIFAIAVVCGGVAFALAGYQAGIFGPAPSRSDTAPTSVVEEKKETPRAKFPDDLAPCARAEPVSQAAALNTAAETHRLVFLKSTGGLHPWQEKVNEDWAAETVEATELVVVSGPQKKTFLSIQHYPDGAPPVSRYKFEVEVSVVEARTGNVLANRRFINMPREIKHLESWELTALGQAVSFGTVFQWVVATARAGFPPEMNPAPPLTNVIR